jgi:hypothetical protein
MQLIGPAIARAIAERIPAAHRAAAVNVDDARDRRAWIESHLVIRPKQTSEGIIPLRLNRVQRMVWSTWGERAFHGIRQSVLKFRQGGISTLVLAYFFESAVAVPNTNVRIISDDIDDAKEKLRTVRLFIQGLGEDAPTRRYENVNFIEFDNGSTFRVETAQNLAIGRGTTIHKVLLSEAARYPDMEEILTGVTQAVPADGDIVIETTANGYGSYHQQHYQDIVDGGRPGWTTLFLPWFQHEEYRTPLDPGETLELTAEEQVARARHGITDEQVKWRRQKKGELKDKFPQEHPETADEAFLLSGRGRFDRAALMRITPREPIKVEDSGALRIYGDIDMSRRYYIGADTAEGLERGDFDSAHVVDGVTGQEVAVLHGTWAPVFFADKLHELGKRFNHALIAVERNNHGHAVLMRLLEGAEGRKAYPRARIYCHVLEETDSDHWRPGWPTDVVTKPRMEAGLDALLEKHPECFADGPTVTELIGVVYRKDGSVGAPAGGHDDRFMSRGIAEMCRYYGPIWERSQEQRRKVYDERVRIGADI